MAEGDRPGTVNSRAAKPRSRTDLYDLSIEACSVTSEEEFY